LVATRHVSIEEFAATSGDGHWELIDGEPVAVTPSADRSGWIAGEIFGLLRNHVRAENTGWAFPPETGFVLLAGRATVRSPYAAYVRQERLPEFTDHVVPVPPDLAVEVLSPSDRMADALSKVAMYLEAGVSLVWLVDPATRAATVFRPDAAPRTVDDKGTLEGSEVLPRLVIPLAEVFDRV
jgi:Uma2 family endonuclease